MKDENNELEELMESYTCPRCDAMVQIYEFDQQGILCDDCQKETGVKWMGDLMKL